MTIEAPNYSFCPFCGTPLEKKVLEGIDRKFCPQDKWVYFPHIATAAAAVIRKENQVYLVQRNKDPYKGTWSFPAGFTEYGEHPQNTVVREVLEETGYKVSNPRFIDVLQVLDDPREPGHLVFFYQVDISEKDRSDISDKDENQSMGWFTIDQLPEIGWESHRIIASRIFSGTH